MRLCRCVFVWFELIFVRVCVRGSFHCGRLEIIWKCSPVAPRDISLSISPPTPLSYINVKHCSYRHQNMSFKTDCTSADFLKLRCLWPAGSAATNKFFLLCKCCRDNMTKLKTCSISTNFFLLNYVLVFLLLHPIDNSKNQSVDSTQPGQDLG